MLVALVLIVRLYRYLLTLTAYANLSVISKESLNAKLTCVHDLSGRRAAFDALTRHANIFGGCGDSVVDYACWKDSVATATLMDLYFLSLWCK